MEKYDLKKGEIKFHNIVIAITSEPDYEMERWLLLENLKDIKYGEYVVVNGYHCSCYNFDDTDWEATKYTEEELKKIAKDRVERKTCLGGEEHFYKLVLEYLGRE